MVSASITVADVLTGLRSVPDSSIHTVVTSPPYWGLRDYGTGEWQGGDPSCDHRGRSQTSPASTLGDWKSGGGAEYKEGTGGMPFRGQCGKCGAVRVDRQIGLERTPEEYIGRLVEVFREVKRVLRDDGTLWLNIGDSYANDGKWGGATGGKHVSDLHGEPVGRGKRMRGLKPKDLVGIPWMLAFAFRADGWYLRQDIIWHKPNPMPESVTDRCTKAHEYIFLLSKAQRYYYDAKAIQEPVSQVSLARAEYGWNCDRPSTKNASMGGQGIHTEKMGTRFVNPEGRNRRSVWTVATHPYREAHFATYPEALIAPCILAGSPPAGTVLDPFCGSGTTGVVALRHGRSFIGFELNPEYAALAEKRIREDSPLFNYPEVVNG